MRVEPGPFLDDKIMEGQFDGKRTFLCEHCRRQMTRNAQSGFNPGLFTATHALQGEAIWRN